MPDILAAIDRTTDYLCPCGAQPAPGSAYCSDDCQPTDGTRRLANAMRWRPDPGPYMDDMDGDPWADTHPVTLPSEVKAGSST